MLGRVIFTAILSGIVLFGGRGHRGADWGIASNRLKKFSKHENTYK